MSLPIAIRGNEAEANLGRLSIVYDLRRISIAEGLRAAVAVAAIVLVNEWVQWPPLLLAALAAMLACLADAGGPPGRQLKWLLAFALLGGLITTGFGMLRAEPIWLVVPAGCLGIFTLAFLRIYGQSGVLLGNLLSTTLVLALDRPQSPHDALIAGGCFALGALWAVLLSLGLWRLRPFQPARRAVAGTYRALAELTRDLRDLVRPGAYAHGQGAAADNAIWEAHARAHRRAVRSAIEAAREAVLGTTRQRGRHNDRALGAIVRLESADQMFGALIALSDLLEAERDPAVLATAHRMLRVLRPLCVVLEHAAEADATMKLARVERGIASVAQSAAALPTPMRMVAEHIVDQLHIAATLAAPEDFLPLSAATKVVHWRDAAIGPIAANRTLRSPALRHALRAGLVALPAFAVTMWWPTTYGHWLTITLVLTLQPFTAMTWARAIERIGGTLVGGLIAAALSIVLTGPLSLALAIVPLAVACFALRPAGFGLMITFLTPLVVLLSELGRPGESEVWIALMRAIFTLSGGLLSIAGGLLLWPSREPARLRTALRLALLAHAAYAEAIFASQAGHSEGMEAARREAGRTSNELETSLSRAMLEPGRSAARLDAALLIDAALRRLAGRLSAVQLGAVGSLAPQDWLVWRDWTGAALRALAVGQAPEKARPDAGRSDILARITRQVALMAGAVGRAMD